MGLTPIYGADLVLLDGLGREHLVKQYPVVGDDIDTLKQDLSLLRRCIRFYFKAKKKANTEVDEMVLKWTIAEIKINDDKPIGYQNPPIHNPKIKMATAAKKIKLPIKLLRPIVFFDLETTGVDIINDKIVEIGVVKLHPDGKREVKRRLVNPGIPIPPEVTEIHGITDKDVAGEPPFEKIAKNFAAFMKDCDLGGYNIINFDLPFLAQEFNRIGIEFPDPPTKFVDAMKIFHAKERRDLTAAYKFYCKKDLDDAHSAEADTIATVEIFLAQMKAYKGEDKLPDNVAEIQDFTMDGKGMVDLAGKLVKDTDGTVLYNFGKNKGRPIEHDKGYAGWMLTGEFTENTKRKLREILGG